MGLRGTLLLGLVGVVAVLALLLSTQEWGLGRLPDGTPRFKYLLEDVSDRSVYQQRGAWLPTGLTPYVQVHSEYPQLATWLFGVPYLFFDTALGPGAIDDGRFRPSVATLRAENEPYGRVFQILMAPALLVLLLCTALCLRELGRSPAWTLLYFLPGPLYFTFSRFDVLPSMLVMVALLLQLRGRRTGAAAALALGAMMKWYPALLLPLFVSHSLWGEDAPQPREGWRARLPGAVLWPGLAAAVVVLVILAINFLWDGGGLPAVLHHYEWHIERVPNGGSLVWALSGPGRWGWFPESDMPLLIKVLTAIQFAPALLLACFPVRDRRTLVLGCLTVVLAFTLFTKDFSPQWIVWIAPLAILLARGSWPCLLLLVVLEVLVWIQMPLFHYERLGRPGGTLEGAVTFWAASDARLALMALFFLWSVVSFFRAVRGRRERAAAEPVAGASALR